MSLIVLAGVLSALTACTSTSRGSGQRSSTASAGGTTTGVATPTAATPTSSAPVTSAPATSIASTTSTTAGVQGCSTSSLSLAAGDAQGAAGSTYEDYLLVNRGASPCTLTGFPGVSFLNAAGTTLGVATRSTTMYATITLGVGQTASFMVHTSNLGSDAGCAAATQTTTTLLVYPPNETTTLRVPTTQAACQPQVGPVQLGTQATP